MTETSINTAKCNNCVKNDKIVYGEELDSRYNRYPLEYIQMTN